MMQNGRIRLEKPLSSNHPTTCWLARQNVCGDRDELILKSSDHIVLLLKYNDRKCRQQNTEHASNAKSVSVINKIWRHIVS